jgi:hypothetical protein
MSKYNIIYTSPDGENYLWNGKSFDDLESAEREVLFFSGKSVNDEEVKDALIKCKAAAKASFPEDSDPQIKSVEINVSN